MQTWSLVMALAAVVPATASESQQLCSSKIKQCVPMTCPSDADRPASVRQLCYRGDTQETEAVLELEGIRTVGCRLGHAV